MVEDSTSIRGAIFEDLLRASSGGQLPLTRDWLRTYQFGGVRVPLIDPGGRGIRNPNKWDCTLSITTTEKGKYADRALAPGVWSYPLAVDKNGKLDPSNRKFKNAHMRQAPVIYFYKPVPNLYLVVGMVEVISYDEAARVSTISLITDGIKASAVEQELERLYVRRVVDARLHQPRFREVVLSTYRDRCAVCELPDRSLLDAAHIRSDKDLANGQPVVQNGMALCAIHHRAYDAHVIGIDQEFRIHVHPRIMQINDGPTFEHGIKQLHRERLAVVPKGDKGPDPYRLDLTFKEFLSTIP